MTQQYMYARDQPQGFTNRIERVAIVGAGGSVGRFIAEALVATGRHTVTAISRIGSRSKVPAGLAVVSVDYDDDESLVSALKNQQFLIISMAVAAPPDTQAKLIRAAAKAGVKWVLPNSYSSDFTNKSLREENLTGPAVMPGIEAAEKAGVSWIAMVCSFWYEHSVAQGPEWYGFDLQNKKMTFYDDGKTRINTTTWLQCGRAMAALLSLKELPDDENDSSLTVSRWKNKPLWISSFFVSQREMLDSIQRVSGETDADWAIEYEPSADRWKRGMESLKNGDLSGMTMAMYARTFYPNGDGDIQSKGQLDNKVLGLPKEDMDEASKRAIELVERGYNYFTR